MKKTIMSHTRRVMLSLILVLSIAAVASIIKVQAASVITGWLWGGTEETSDGTINGNETGVYWVSMNSKNCDKNGNGTIDAGDSAAAGCSAIGTTIPSYGVNIPSGNGSLSGYAWASTSSGGGIGWIDFNPNGDDNVQGTPDDHCTTGVPGPGQYKAASCTPDSGSGCSAGVARTGTDLEGCARIVSIAQGSADNNSGGWKGWIKMREPSKGYQVKVSNMTGSTNHLQCDNGNCAWSDELGWFDFTGAKVENVCAIDNVSGANLTKNNNCQSIAVTLKDNMSGDTVTVTTLSSKIFLADNETSCGSSRSGGKKTATCTVSNANDFCFVYVTADSAAFLTDSPEIITATSSCGDTKNGTVNIIHTPDCIVDAPDSVEVRAGSTQTYNVTVTKAPGETGSCALEGCNLQTGHSENITGASKVSGESKCSVTAGTTSNFGTGDVKAVAGTGEAITKVYVRAPGWVEANPSR